MMLVMFTTLHLLKRGGLAIVAMQQMPRSFFFENAWLFFKMRGILKISEKLRIFKLMRGFFKDCDAFKTHLK
jgi:hypothetical protein